MKFPLLRGFFLSAYFILCGLFSFAQNNSSPYFHLRALSLDSALQGSLDVRLDTLWKMKEGRMADSAWLLPGADDSRWKFSGTEQVEKMERGGVLYFRLNLVIDSSLRSRMAALIMVQTGASEIFLNGKKVVACGNPGDDASSEKRYNPNKLPFAFQLGAQDTQLIAVRYSNHHAWDRSAKSVTASGFALSVEEVNEAFTNYSAGVTTTVFYVTIISGLFYTLGFVHVILFLFQRRKISNLFYSVFALSIGIMFHMVTNTMRSHDPDSGTDYMYWSSYLWCLIPVSLLALLYKLYYEKYTLSFKIFAGSYALVVFSLIFHMKFGIYLAMLNGVATCVEFIRIVIWSIWKKKDGAWIIGSGLIGFVFLFVGLFLFVMLYYKGFENVKWNSWAGISITLLYFLGVLGIPLSMSVYLARDFAITSKKLSKKLEEVEELSAKSIEQEKEKQKILESQKQLLEDQVRERTKEISFQKKVIEEKNKEMIDSINYASRIQRALLAPEKYIARNLKKLSKPLSET